MAISKIGVVSNNYQASAVRNHSNVQSFGQKIALPEGAQEQAPKFFKKVLGKIVSVAKIVGKFFVDLFNKIFKSGKTK